MIVDATYKCRRKQTKTYPMQIEAIRGIVKAMIIYDPKALWDTFSDKCESCKYATLGFNTDDGRQIKMCTITLEGIKEQTEDVSI